MQSVSVQCADPTSPGSGVTSYVYGPSSSQGTPNVTFSSASTTIDLSSGQNNSGYPKSAGSASSSGSSGGASSGDQGSSNSNSKFTTPVIVGIAIGGVAALLLGALVIRACAHKFGSSKGGAESYQPLEAPAPPPVDNHYSGGRY